MQTRRGFWYPRSETTQFSPKDNKRKKGRWQTADDLTGRKQGRVAAEVVVGGRKDLFDGLPDDLVISIISKLSSSAASPSDLVSILITCKKMNELGQHPLVLSKASAKSLAVRAKNWSDSACRFLTRCADVGNLEACYTLGMIEFYCLENRRSGASLMARSAIGSHAEALYSLAVMQFNGSGRLKNDRDLRAGVALCVGAAVLGHVDALRELGHCLQDGYGVPRDVTKGRRLLVQANAREFAAVLSSPNVTAWRPHDHRDNTGSGCPLLSDFGYDVPAPEGHPANMFMVEWFEARAGPGAEGQRLCFNAVCGRPETRKNEFRRCSVCGAVKYCSRACQALHWKLAHKIECTPMDRWIHDAAVANDNGVPTNDGDASRRGRAVA